MKKRVTGRGAVAAGRGRRCGVPPPTVGTHVRVDATCSLGRDNCDSSQHTRSRESMVFVCKQWKYGFRLEVRVSKQRAMARSVLANGHDPHIFGGLIHHLPSRVQGGGCGRGGRGRGGLSCQPGLPGCGSGHFW